jgi:hypothetical protein
MSLNGLTLGESPAESMLSHYDGDDGAPGRDAQRHWWLDSDVGRHSALGLESSTVPVNGGGGNESSGGVGRRGDDRGGDRGGRGDGSVGVSRGAVSVGGRASPAGAAPSDAAAAAAAVEASAIASIFGTVDAMIRDRLVAKSLTQ